MSEASPLRGRDSSNLPRLGKPRLLLTVQSLRYDPASEHPSYTTNIQPWLVRRARARPSYLPGESERVDINHRVYRARNDIPL